MSSTVSHSKHEGGIGNGWETPTRHSAYDSNIGAIRQMFLRDRAQQDLHLDEIATSHAPADASGGDTPTPPSWLGGGGDEVRAEKVAIGVNTFGVFLLRGSGIIGG